MSVSPSFSSVVDISSSHVMQAVPRGAEGLALANLLEKSPVIIHVAVNDRQVEALASVLPFFAADARIIRFPAWNCLPYDRISPSSSIAAERVLALGELAQGKRVEKTIILTTVNACLQRVPPPERFAKGFYALKRGAYINREQLIAFLNAQGYRRVGKAVEPGEYVVRGSLMDIIPSGAPEGARLDFFGDELETLRQFDPLTQLSSAPLESLTLHAVSELILEEESIERFRSRYREMFGAVSREDPLYEAISNGQHYPGMEHWLPLFYERMASFFDYAKDALITLEAEARNAIHERQETVQDYYEARLAALAQKRVGNAPYHPLKPEALYLMEHAWEHTLAARSWLAFSPFLGQPGAPSLEAQPSVNFAAHRTSGEWNPYAQLREFAGNKRAEGKSTVLACLSSGSRERLQELLTKAGAHAVRVEHWREAAGVKGSAIGLAVASLEHGFEMPRVALVSEQDLLGERVIRAQTKKKTPANFLAEAANFFEGELIVHREHGIGRFDGLITLEVSAAKHDCLKLLYADDDKLFVPVENIEVLSRFGAEEEGVRLDKLGAASWQSRKARMKERITLAAESLLKIAAERMVKTSPVIESATAAYGEFCARFPYAETEDQERSITEVLEDLQSGRPMDRLVCGDVGFGKTEVALRAAFAAATGEPRLQVAVIVPTTLLARQHYKNFAERFSGFPVRVAQLSRMVPAKAQAGVREGIKDGSVDIVVGTHALLAKGISFKRLGLVIVDEEQHFGVAQKEKLKSLKSEVHMLTLSATPIPRTLQMALSGVRELSLITTPPVDRLAVRSFVMPFDPVVLREAILREQHRGGRTFVVTQRIKDMAELRQQLEQLVPEVKIVSAHGQMPPADLDRIMNEFYDGKFDVLLSTAIVESGLDIPTANTMIIHRADRFGLAQLYQLRGRVGRGKIRAYAYFLLPARKELSRTAERRLEIMQSLDTLGAGFTLASHDMDIRGFGNLVGEEQSGHIREVGIELYQQMLEEAVAALKVSSKQLAVGSEEQLQTDWSPQINLGLSVLIPEDYVADLSLRLGLYRRAALLDNAEEIDAFAAELIDRFGSMPDEVKQLLAVVGIKQQCKRAGVERIDVGPKGAVMSFHKDSVQKPEALLAYLAKNPTRLKLRPDQKLVLMREWKIGEDKAEVLGELLEELARL